MTEALADTNRIKARVYGRNTAREVVGLLSIEAEPPELQIEISEAFIDELWKLLPQRPVAEQSKPALEPIARLGRLQIPFGIHKGKVFDDVPLDYLDWLAREQEGFYKSLRAYLTHPDLQSRRGHEFAEDEDDSEQGEPDYV